MIKEGREAKVAYPCEGQADDVAGRSFHHGRFVQQLRLAAATQATVTIRQGFVRKLLNGKRVRGGGGSEQPFHSAAAVLLGLSSIPHQSCLSTLHFRHSAECGEGWEEGQAVTGVCYKGLDGEDHTAQAHLTVRVPPLPGAGAGGVEARSIGEEVCQRTSWRAINLMW